MSTSEHVTAGVAPAGAYPDHLRAEVERYLQALRFAREPAAAGLEEAMRYSLLAGGKRIRPVLALATARALGREPTAVLPLAAALELIHTYSLIHDDLPAMDDDDLRRGRPTCHVRFGEDVAILAGDGLYAEAFRLVLARAARASRRPCSPRCASWRTRPGVNGMVGGQYIDVRGAGRARRRGPAPPARAQDRAADRRLASSAYCSWRALPSHHLNSPASVRSQPSWACSSRSSTTSST